MQIKIVSGVYGARVNGYTRPIYRGDTVDVTPEEADRLVALGVAEKTGQNEASEAVESPAVETVYTEEDLKAMNYKKLQSIATKLGAEGDLTGKAECIEAILKLQSPILKTEDPV